MDPDTVQVMVRVVTVGMITWRLLTRPGGVFVVTVVCESIHSRLGNPPLQLDHAAYNLEDQRFKRLFLPKWIQAVNMLIGLCSLCS